MKNFSAIALGGTLGCGLMAGLFFAFSVCVMTALAGLPPGQGMTAMQAVNVVILNPVFLFVFTGTAAACVYALVVSLLNQGAPCARFLLCGSVCYLAGVLLVTIVFNVPMNDALAAAKPGTPESNGIWANYLSVWTMWNHVRTVASLAATLLFSLALYHGVR